MPREKSPGLKILWLWTLGTAAILVTTVVRTRLRDMDSFMNAQQQDQQEPISSDVLLVDTVPESEDVVREERS
ncbi:basic leucine zipper/W2 domain protein [Fagus crenata]